MQKTTKKSESTLSILNLQIKLPSEYLVRQPKKGIETMALYGYLVNQAIRKIKELDYPNKEKLDELAYLCETYFDFAGDEIKQNSKLFDEVEDDERYL